MARFCWLPRVLRPRGLWRCAWGVLGEFWLRSCCSGWNGSEYPWNRNNSSSRNIWTWNDLSFQIADVNILERNTSFLGPRAASSRGGCRRIRVGQASISQASRPWPFDEIGNPIWTRQHKLMLCDFDPEDNRPDGWNAHRCGHPPAVVGGGQSHSEFTGPGAFAQTLSDWRTLACLHSTRRYHIAP